MTHSTLLAYGATSSLNQLVNHRQRLSSWLGELMQRVYVERENIIDSAGTISDLVLALNRLEGEIRKAEERGEGKKKRGRNSLPDMQPLPVNEIQETYYDIWEDYSLVYWELRKLSLCGRFEFKIGCRVDGTEKTHKYPCNSPLCLKCSAELWRRRARKAADWLERFLSLYNVWSVWTFTLPDMLWEDAMDWGILVVLGREAIRILRDVGHAGGLIRYHTFSSSDATKAKPHIHLISFRSSAVMYWDRELESEMPGVDYAYIYETWAGVLKEKFGYVCKRDPPSKRFPNGKPKISVQEGRRTELSKGGPFLVGGESASLRNKVLYNKVHYELRFAGQSKEKPNINYYEGGVFKHYEISLGRKGYDYWGEVKRAMLKMAIKNPEKTDIHDNFVPVKSNVVFGVPKKDKDERYYNILDYVGHLGDLSRKERRLFIRVLRKHMREFNQSISEVILGYVRQGKAELVVPKPKRKKYNICPKCGAKMELVIIWDGGSSRPILVNNELLEYLNIHFPERWGECMKKYQQYLDSWNEE